MSQETCAAYTSAMVTVPDAAGHLVFVSHSGEDTWVAKQIARCIGECGARPFLDQADVPVGAEFEEDVRDFLDRADELVVLFTPWSLECPYVWAEIGAAWIRRIPIIVLLLGLSATEFQSRPHAPVFLKKRNIISLNEVDAYLAELRGRAEAEKSHV